ncbi:MAG: hypothetical protein KDK39_06825 [Leptospiraceae bacterium]|nr:hypothetical protein [Leptospiraceae bacterium]
MPAAQPSAREARPLATAREISADKTVLNPGPASAAPIRTELLYKSGEQKELQAPLRGWDVIWYRGQYSDTDFGQILLNANTRFKNSFIDVLALNRDIPYTLLSVPLEGEGQVVRHSGRQRHMEYNAVLIARWGDPFQGLPLSFGFGEGLSLATRNPDMENQRRTVFHPNVTEEEDSRNLLNYLVVELEMGLHGFDSHRARAFLRLHHRSGIYGTFCPPTCGSNFVAYGVKFGF